MLDYNIALILFLVNEAFKNKKKKKKKKKILHNTWHMIVQWRSWAVMVSWVHGQNQIIDYAGPDCDAGPGWAVHWAGGKHSNWITDANAATKHLFKGLMSSQAEVGDEWLHWLNDSTSKHLVLCTELNIPAGVISLFYSVPRNIICIFSSSVPMVK